MPIPFLTLRNATGSETPAEFYGNDRSDLKASVCVLREVGLDVLSPLTSVAPSFVREELLRLERINEYPAPLLVDETVSNATAESALQLVAT